MKMCDTHWAQLRADIEKYELEHLVAPDGASAAQVTQRQMQGTTNPLDFEPMISAFFQLSKIAVEFMGMYMLQDDKCPACELRDYNWVEGAAYQQRLYAEQNGLVLDLPRRQVVN